MAYFGMDSPHMGARILLLWKWVAYSGYNIYHYFRLTVYRNFVKILGKSFAIEYVLDKIANYTGLQSYQKCTPPEKFSRKVGKSSYFKEDAWASASDHHTIYSLTHSFPMHPFSTPWKHQKTVRSFQGVEKGYTGYKWVNSKNEIPYLTVALWNSLPVSTYFSRALKSVFPLSMDGYSVDHSF